MDSSRGDGGGTRHHTAPTSDRRPRSWRCLPAQSASLPVSRSVPMPSNLLASSPFPSASPDPFLASFWSVRPLAFWKPSYLATNRMKCRENRCTIFVPAPPTPTRGPFPLLLPPLQQHFYCVQIVCGAPPTPLATTARSSTTFGTHLPKHFTYSEAKVCDAAPPALACQCGSCRRLVTTAPLTPSPCTTVLCSHSLASPLRRTAPRS